MIDSIDSRPIGPFDGITRILVRSELAAEVKVTVERRGADLLLFLRPGRTAGGIIIPPPRAH